MNDQQLAAERAAFETWFRQEVGMPDFVSFEQTAPFAAFAFKSWQAALAQREPAAEGEVAQVCGALRKGQALRGGGTHMANYIADLLERTEAARQEVEREFIKRMDLDTKQMGDLKTQLTVERARSEVLAAVMQEVIDAENSKDKARQFRSLLTISERLKDYQSSQENGNG